MTVIVVIAAVVIVAVSLRMWQRREQRRENPEPQRLAELAAADDSPLLQQILGLRGDLTVERNKRLRDRVVALLVVLGFLYLLAGQRNTLDDIVAARRESRIATCQALDNIFMKHNHFVQTTINERQSIIDQSDASPTASDAQKQATRAFFGGQIANYKSDLVAIVNCNDPAQVAALFTPTKPGG